MLFRSSTKQQSDEMLEDIKAITELKPSGIILFTNYINSILFGGVLLLGRQPLVQKRLFTGKFQNQYKSIFQTNRQLFFLYLFCLAKNVQGLFLIYAFDINYFS